MSVHLSGGPNAGPVSRFVAEAQQRAAESGRASPRVAVVSVGDARTDPSRTRMDDEVEVVELRFADGEAAELSHIADVDGLVVPDGDSAAILAALDPISGEIRRRVSQGWPYLGVGAGASLAAETTLLGGNRIGGVAVSPGVGPGEIRPEHGLGLIDVAVDAGTAEQGTLSRIVAAVEAGLIPAGLGVDGGTVLTVSAGTLQIAGAGSVWRVTPGDSGVVVSTLGES